MTPNTTDAARTTTAGQVVSADGTAIAYERSGAGPALVLVDGACCYRAFGPLRPLARLLAEDFTVFTYDRRGRGESGDTLPYAVEREVEDLAALIAEAGGSASLYGVSSGAVLSLYAAAAGLTVPRLVLFEPPIEPDRDGAAFTEEVADLVAADRRWDAVAHFQSSIGVPPEVTARMDDASRATLAAIAHTLPYDLTITGAADLDLVASVDAPTLVLDSEGSTGDLTGWAAAVVAALPHGSHRSLDGRWHVVPDDALAPAITTFLRDTP